MLPSWRSSTAPTSSRPRPGSRRCRPRCDAAEVMLDEIAAAGRPVGIKPSGGISTADEAARYIADAERVMGTGWVIAGDVPVRRQRPAQRLARSRRRTRRRCRRPAGGGQLILTAAEVLGVGPDLFDGAACLFPAVEADREMGDVGVAESLDDVGRQRRAPAGGAVEDVAMLGRRVRRGSTSTRDRTRTRASRAASTWRRGWRPVPIARAGHECRSASRRQPRSRPAAARR